MVSKGSALGENVNLSGKKSSSRSSFSKKDGTKIHKAEREKRKRGHMNELFLELSNALGEPANQNTGKSSALTDTIRNLRNLIAQVDSLKKENSTLLAESQYVGVENNELKDENSAIVAQILKLQNQIEERVHCQSSWGINASPQLPCIYGTVPPVIDSATQAAPPVMGPIFMMPLQSDPKLYAEPKNIELEKELPPNVSKPHARYPSTSDTWPFNFLCEKPRVV